MPIVEQQTDKIFKNLISALVFPKIGLFTNAILE